MKVRVQYMAQLRSAVGCSEEQLDLPEGNTLSRLLGQIAERHREAKPHLLNENKQVRPSLLLVVNDVAVSARDAETMPLSDGDSILLLPPIAGG
jgi:molybdopterin synthase sulfur carrier subunit